MKLPADSVLLGGFAFSITAITSAMLLIWGPRALADDSGTLVFGGWACVSPVFAAINVLFIARDAKAQRQNEAFVGAMLTGAAVFFAWFPLLLAD